MGYTATQLQGMYWEDYCDQESTEFKVLSCSVPGRDVIIEDITQNLAAQVHELWRRYGRNACIRVYKEA